MDFYHELCECIWHLCHLGYPYDWLMRLPPDEFNHLVQVELDYAQGVTYG